MREKLYGLQALRALAATLVIFAHALLTYRQKISPLAELMSGINLGDFGVKIFFCISGFIICHSSHDMPAGLASVRAFCWRRAVRIVPLYWTATCLYAAKLALQGRAPTLAEMVSSLLFVPYGPPPMHPVLGVGWTLNFEVFFYLAFGASLLAKRPLRIFAFLAVFTMTALAEWLGLFAWMGDGILVKALASFADIYLVYFVLGVVLALLGKPLRTRLVRLALPPSQTVVVASATIFMGLWASWWFRPTGPAAELLMLACIFTAVVFCIIETPPTAGQVNMAVRCMQIAGDASYSSYLTHGFVMGPCARLVAMLRIDITANLFASLMVMAATLVGILVYRCFELPVLRQLGKRYQPGPIRKSPGS